MIGEGLFSFAESKRRWTLTIPGDPVAKGRGRIVKRGKHLGIITPEKTRRYEDIVRQTAIFNWRAAPLDNLQLTLEIEFYMPIPKSFSKRDTQSAMTHAKRPACRPDLDNCIKSVTDGLNGVVYRDDAMLVGIKADKFYSIEPRVELLLVW